MGAKRAYWRKIRLITFIIKSRSNNKGSGNFVTTWWNVETMAPRGILDQFKRIFFFVLLLLLLFSFLFERFCCLLIRICLSVSPLSAVECSTEADSRVRASSFSSKVSRAVPQRRACVKMLAARFTISALKQKRIDG